MMKHTPGPWEAVSQTHSCDPDHRTYVFGITRPGLDDRFIAKVGPSHKNRYTAEDAANARLIAAAPDLLEACEAMSQHRKGYNTDGSYRNLYNENTDAVCGKNWCRVMTLVDTAIAKASGSQ